MGKTGNKNAFEVPTYTPPSYDNYSLLGATASKKGNNFSVDYSDQAAMDTVNKLRSDLLASLGLNSGGADDPYTQELMKESLRLSQPKLENSLIGRGLGGSTIYKDSLTDLISKAGTQAILSGQNYKLNNLNALQNYLSNQQNLGQNLLQLQQAGYNTKASLYDKQYQQLLAQAMSDYDFQGKMNKNDLLASKILSIVDPGGSYLGFWNNPTKTGQNAQDMQGLGKALQLYSVVMSMMGNKGGGMGNTNTTDYVGQIQPYQSYGSLVDLYNGYNDPYSGLYNKNYSSLTGLKY
jgi:hypothetical protein